MSDLPERREVEAVNRLSFGERIAEVRKSKGLGQSDVADRISTYYSDARAYRRIERGERTPPRSAAIAILRHGLEITDIAQSNRLLALLNYSPLTEGESGEIGPLEPRPPAVLSPSTEIAGRSRWAWAISLSYSKATLPILVGLSLCLACFIVRLAEYGSPFAFFSSILYASLYPVSVLLESVYQPTNRGIGTAAVITFCLMLLSSVAALALDSILVQTGGNDSMPWPFALCLLASAAQWLLVRPALSSKPVVAARYQTHTAQGAHFKNTLYFLVIVAFFWLPTFHCVLAFRRQMRLGHSALSRPMLSQFFMMGQGVICLSPGALIGCLLALLVASLLMRGQLLDNLKTDPHVNRYTNLFYLRAAVYFGLCIICIWWYARALDVLIP